jgi:DNA-directed RNA polymerase subunit RPC12/RpoP
MATYSDYSSKKFFRCGNCKAEAVFVSVVQHTKDIPPRCPACGTEDSDYIYWGKCLTEEEAWELVNEHGENEEFGIELVDMHAGYAGSRTYKVRGYPGELTI